MWVRVGKKRSFANPVIAAEQEIFGPNFFQLKSSFEEDDLLKKRRNENLQQS